MQSSISYGDNLCTPLGERRGKSDLARFSLDLSWARAVSDNSRSRAYPSPPMSGSPPIPPRPNLDAGDRGHGSYVSSGQGGYRGLQTSRLEQSEQRGQMPRTYPEQAPSIPYPGPYSMQHLPPGFNPYLPQHQQLPQISQQQHRQHNDYAPHLPQQHAPFSTADRTPIREQPSEFSSPKQQRKTKGHVASACVPCKRAHLRCDAQRPCSRCLSNGKEDTCVDVQHKKRGRPRLRDERESRYEGVAPGYPPPVDHSMRRPLPLYNPNDPSMGTNFSDPLQRGGAYRVLKSQQVGSMGGPMPPRHLEYGSAGDANIYGPPVVLPPRPIPQQEPACAYLTMEMQVVKASPSFGETIGLQSIASRNLQDILSPTDREKVARLQTGFEHERRDREPSYLPPIYLAKYEEDRLIGSVGFGQEEISQVRTDRQEMFTFQAPDGQQRTFQVRLGLAKQDSTYFVVLMLNVPSTPQVFHQPASSPYARESHSRESQYGYQNPQQPFNQTINPPSFAGSTSFADPRGDMNTYRTPSSLGPPTPQTSAPIAGYPQPQQRAEYAQAPTPYAVPRSEMSQSHQPRQHDHLQLPPIRDQRSEATSVDNQRRDDRSGRLDIGGLLEKPGSGQRRS